MPALIGALEWLRALAAPWAGRLLLRVLPWAVPLLPVLRGLAVAACLAAALGAVIWLAWPDPRQMTQAEAKQACEDAMARAELAATRDALRHAQETLRWRATAIDMAEEEIETLRTEMEALRAAAPDPDAPVFAADDPWLRRRSR